jgi:glutamine amidotransferase-like uncharacterized protein
MTARIVSALILSFVFASAGTAAPKPLTVGVYAGEGTGAEDLVTLKRALGTDESLTVRVLDSIEVGGLKSDPFDGVDVLVVGGGSGTTLGKGLGEAGGTAVATFVREGGGYVGLGAGAYLGARGYNTGTRVLELVDAALVNRPGWKIRGEGEVTLAPAAGQPMGELPASLWFSKGPLFAQARGKGRVPYTPVASFVTDLNETHKRQKGVMPGTDAIVCAKFGQGRAALFSVLLHHSEAGVAFLPKAIRWAAGEGEALSTAEPQAPKGAVKVAILDDEGCIGGCVSETFVCLDEEEKTFWARRVNAAEVRAGVLDGFDVVMLPGGSANKMTRGLQEAGRDRVRDFVRKGGGYVGVCAGAYMGASEPSHYGLGLAAVRCADTKHWRRGGGQRVDVEAATLFEEFSGVSKKAQRIFYMNGPLLEIMEVEGLPPVDPLLTFVSDVHDNDAPAGVMPGKLAGLRTEFKKGRVVLFSVHPELTAGYERTIVRSVLWAARRATE